MSFQKQGKEEMENTEFSEEFFQRRYIKIMIFKGIAFFFPQ